MHGTFLRGKIFLGDSGAYIIGFLLAILSILTVKRNPEISPWFPIAVLAYPIFETLFSIYRRKFIQKKSPLKNDGLHLHTLIYRRITKGNPKTSLYIWPLVSCFKYPCTHFSFKYIHADPYICFIFIQLYMHLSEAREIQRSLL